MDLGDVASFLYFILGALKRLRPLLLLPLLPFPESQFQKLKIIRTGTGTISGIIPVIPGLKSFDGN